MRGYLVVLADLREFVGVSKNERYRGVGRMPPYPSDFPEEQVAIDSYVFGGFKDENGIIPSLKKAKELIRLFASSPRRMEIIYYETTDEPDQMRSHEGMKFLGFDVAFATGDRWSVVLDFPESQAMQGYLERLNEHGLFSDEATGIRFLQEYCSRKLPDYEMGLDVLRVFGVESI